MLVLITTKTINQNPSFDSIYKIIIEGVNISLVSHPPHLLDQKNTASPSSFIPFCAFQSQLNISEPITFLPDSSFPVCNSFTPVALNGQLCYNIKVNMTGRNGKDGGLVLVLDLNEDRSLSFDSLSHSEAEEDFTMWRLDERDQDARNDPKIHLRLLTPFIGIGGGSYHMTSVTKMMGTESFLAMQEKDRRCVHEKAEDCQNRKIYEKCGCFPWELQSIQVIFLVLQVVFFITTSLSFLSGGCAVFSKRERLL